MPCGGIKGNVIHTSDFRLHPSTQYQANGLWQQPPLPTSPGGREGADVRLVSIPWMPINRTASCVNKMQHTKNRLLPYVS